MPLLFPPGWQPGSSPGSKVSRLRHRRVSLVRASAVAALVCGPLALVAVWVSSAANRPSPVVPPAGTTKSAAQSAGGPQGFAEVFVGLWLRGTEGSSQTHTDLEKTVRAMAPGVALPTFGRAPAPTSSVWAVRSEQVHVGAWSVTVAALLDGKSGEPVVRYFSVPVLRGDDHSFVVTDAPATVAALPAATVPPSPYGAEVDPGFPLSATVSQFLAAYLGGAGGADRYLAPRVALPSLGAPYSEVRTERISASAAADGPVGADGRQVRVSAHVMARDGQGRQWPLTYALRLATRGGRWEVLALESGLEGINGGSSKGGA
ncbi:conjugal transfer protein [Streptomyces sp. NPDC050161]|uniref:conjugal transfer protein n=1 Tax=Streptomyces sp. NPDC050161 TaxID=3365604 RepID=UPI00379521FF